MKTIFFTITFLIFSFLIVFGGHYFVYFSLFRFFNIQSVWIKLSLILSFILLPISFIAASILTHYFHNGFVNWFYMISGLWLGFITTLLGFVIIVWGIYGLFSLFAWNINLKILGFIALLIATLYSIYGVWNVYNPRIKEIDVTIKNLPEEWQGKKIVQISDLHLGHVLGKDFFEKVISKVNSIDSEAVFITGDLFDGMGDDFGYVADEINKIKVPRGVYFITGNHETYFGVDKTYSLLENSQIKIFKNDMVKVDGLQILGINYSKEFEKIDMKKIIQEIDNFNPDEPSILIFHNPIQVKSVKEAGIDLELCGHTHGGQIFPIGLIVKLIYYGVDRGLHTDGDFSIYTSLGTGTWGPTMRTTAPPEITVINLNKK
ncbi:metallophosphoesterase [bacterium]|nr:metallophosphoesterase [bacterium]